MTGNFLHTAILLAAMTGLFLAAGFLLGGNTGMVVAFGFALLTNLFAYWNADKLVLRIYRAQPVDAATAPELHAIVRELADRAGLPMPKTYLIDNAQPNAFATGRNPANAAVAVTTGLMQNLSREELTGVVAHELAHIANRDTLIMTITATLAGALSMLANFALFFGGGGRRERGLGLIGTLVLMVLAPLAAGLVQMAISRAREYEADRMGAAICGEPLWLAAALAKLDRAAGVIDNPPAEANPASAHLFIVNPLHAHRVDQLFATHPPIAERIARLRAMAGELAPAPATRGPWGRVV